MSLRNQILLNPDKTHILSQFFTHPETARTCIEVLFKQVLNRTKDSRDIVWIEPSCGSGVFVDELQKCGVRRKDILAIEVDPEYKADWILDISEGGFLSARCTDIDQFFVASAVVACLPGLQRQRTLPFVPW